MKYGLPKATIEQIRGVFARFPEIDKAVLYGSRAKGTHQAGSDIDLTLYGDALTPDLRDRIIDALDDLLLPYTLDLSLFDELDHAKLREHIERVGVGFYERVSQGVGKDARWKTKRLGDVCLFLNGLWKGKVPPFINIGVIRNTNFTKEGTLDDSNIAYLDVEVKKFETRRLQFGDIILEKSGGGPKQPVGRVVLFDKANENFSFSNFTAAIRVLNNDELNFRFLHRFLYWNHLIGGTEKMQSHSTGIRNLDGHAYKSIEIPVPPLPEQKRIVSILDEAFAGISTATANAQRNLQNARALFESHLQSVFAERGKGWVERSLDELGTITSSKRIFKSEYVKSGIPFYRTKEIKELANGRSITTELFISEKRYEEIKKGFGVPNEGDILITAIGTIGEIWVVEGDNDFYIKDGNVLWLKEFKSISPHFLKYVLLSFVENLNKIAHGAAYSALPIHRLNAHKIFLPPPAQQLAIVETLDDLREETQRLEAIYQQKLTALDELKKSILNQAFSGQLH